MGEGCARQIFRSKARRASFHHEGFWSWYNYFPGAKGNFRIFTNSNMNQMATVACWLFEATHEQQFYDDAMLVWNGDAKYPGVAKFYRGKGIWKGNEGQAAFGKQFPWEGAGMCSIGAAMFRMTGEKKYKEIVAATAQRLMDPGKRLGRSAGFLSAADGWKRRVRSFYIGCVSNCSGPASRYSVQN